MFQTSLKNIILFPPLHFPLNAYYYEMQEKLNKPSVHVWKLKVPLKGNNCLFFIAFLRRQQKYYKNIFILPFAFNLQ